MVFTGSHSDSEEDETVMDYKGKPFDRARTGGWLGAGLILGIQVQLDLKSKGTSSAKKTPASKSKKATSSGEKKGARGCGIAPRKKK